jgi:hypothetical protein
MARVAVAYVSPLDGDAGIDLSILAGGDDLEVVAVLRDERGARRSGLAEALQHIAAGDASTLVANRLAALAGSLRELVALLDWLEAARADLVALDVGLDSGSAAGRPSVAMLREIERWGREPEPGRAPRGRPGLAARAPELRERIAAMREQGLSLQAIADALNADGVPTLRGGALWRPSSVQATLGYRRPRPPAPGAPPPPPRHLPSPRSGPRPHPHDRQRPPRAGPPRP